MEQGHPVQNTRLNSLVDVGSERLVRWLQNPWRRTSLLIISLLFGNFLATVVATTTGQTADWDVLVALLLLGLIELTNWLVYGSLGRRSPTVNPVPRSLVVIMLNGIKLGLIYGLFVEAFKLGS